MSPDGKVEMGRVSKKLGLAGMMKELFTSADTFAVTVNEDLSDEPMAKMLILAATLAIDLIYKSESKGGVDSSDLLGRVTAPRTAGAVCRPACGFALIPSRPWRLRVSPRRPSNLPRSTMRPGSWPAGSG